MKSLLCILLFLSLFACSMQSERDAYVEEQDLPVAPPIKIPGFYSGLLPCADCPGIKYDLQLLEDSTFIMFNTYLDRDPIPFGYMGSYKLESGLIGIYNNGVKMFFKPDSKGLTQWENDGPILSRNNFLERTTSNIYEAGSLFRLYGIFNRNDTATVFVPCNSSLKFKVAGNIFKLNNRDLSKYYQALISFSSNEKVFLDEILKSSDDCTD